jgi:hypothetical protein
MTSATSRRAVLGAVLAVGAIRVAPIAAGAATAAEPVSGLAGLDAELFALIERARTADSLSVEASVAADDIWERMEPSFPQALVWTETDALHWDGVRPGQWIPDRDIAFLRDWLNLARKPDPIARGVSIPTVVPTLAFIERAQEIVQTKDEYEAAEQAAKEHPDVLGAQARLDAAIERWKELAKRIATTRAKTTEGLIAKLAFVAPAYDDNNLKGTYDGILASAALDAQALARS